MRRTLGTLAIVTALGLSLVSTEAYALKGFGRNNSSSSTIGKPANQRRFGRFSGRRLLVTGLALVTVAFAAACNKEAPPKIETTDNKEASYSQTVDIPVDNNIYELTGVVRGAPGQLIQRNAEGHISGMSVNGTGGVSGAWYDHQSGKGFIRTQILKLEPANDKIGKVGDWIIIKTTDSKATVLLPGDKITIRARAQYEPVAPLNQNEKFDEAKRDQAGTWELDFGRLVSPQITPDEK